jgi:hypothetical protein
MAIIFTMPLEQKLVKWLAWMEAMRPRISVMAQIEMLAH